MAVKKNEGYKPRTIPENKRQINFNLSSDLYERLRFIAYKDNRSKSDIYTDAIADYVKKWEDKNGKIKL